mmetsp:Transcript_53669/g.156432  ORF Transcript_53669/g.156432 Transcript_53669/m.156432 type:complete len:232 (-) Transcript_53669:75-770(-)
MRLRLTRLCMAAYCQGASSACGRAGPGTTSRPGKQCVHGLCLSPAQEIEGDPLGRSTTAWWRPRTCTPTTTCRACISPAWRQMRPPGSWPRATLLAWASILCRRTPARARASGFIMPCSAPTATSSRTCGWTACRRGGPWPRWRPPTSAARRRRRRASSPRWAGTPRPGRSGRTATCADSRHSTPVTEGRHGRHGQHGRLQWNGRHGRLRWQEQHGQLARPPPLSWRWARA